MHDLEFFILYLFSDIMMVRFYMLGSGVENKIFYKPDCTAIVTPDFSWVFWY
jgi:hypothetical protein